ncbi:MAG: hypothetical protein NC331_05280 [Lachnospiraceae bacterium]|nr:hypothetical protein [Lachnospiraceae bacterium]
MRTEQDKISSFPQYISTKKHVLTIFYKYRFIFIAEFPGSSGIMNTAKIMNLQKNIDLVFFRFIPDPFPVRIQCFRNRVSQNGYKGKPKKVFCCRAEKIGEPDHDLFLACYRLKLLKNQPDGFSASARPDHIFIIPIWIRCFFLSACQLLP